MCVSLACLFRVHAGETTNGGGESAATGVERHEYQQWFPWPSRGASADTFVCLSSWQQWPGGPLVWSVQACASCQSHETHEALPRQPAETARVQAGDPSSYRTGKAKWVDQTLFVCGAIRLHIYISTAAAVDIRNNQLGVYKQLIQPLPPMWLKSYTCVQAAGIIWHTLHHTKYWTHFPRDCSGFCRPQLYISCLPYIDLHRTACMPRNVVCS